MDFDLPTEWAVPFTFIGRPAPLPPELRPEWRIGILTLLLVRCCRDGRSTLRRLHVLNSAVRSQQNADNLMAHLRGEGMPDAVLIRVEPALGRAIDFAAADGVIRIVGGDRVELTNVGRQIAQEISNDDTCLIKEKSLLQQLGMRLTETRVNEILQSKVS